MIGVTELAIIVVIAIILFFGRNVLLDWVKTIAKAKKTLKPEEKAKKKK